MTSGNREKEESKKEEEMFALSVVVGKSYPGFVLTY